MIESENKKLATEKMVVSINNLRPNPYNPNKMSEYVYEKMKQTIKEKGLFGSIYVRPSAGIYEILDGEHRTKACKELGYTEIPVEVAIDEMSELDVKFWTIYFNNTHGKDDIEKRARLYEEMESGQAQLLPFTEEEITHEKELFKFDFDQYNHQENIEEKRTNLISIAVSEEIKNMWNRCLNVSKENKQEISDTLFQMMDSWLDINDLQYGKYKTEVAEDKIKKTIEADKRKMENEQPII
jgi:ParB-like chromosome segregation protein Spo0J